MSSPRARWRSVNASNSPRWFLRPRPG
jgi:hypothetical protein